METIVITAINVAANILRPIKLKHGHLEFLRDILLEDGKSLDN